MILCDSLNMVHYDNINFHQEFLDEIGDIRCDAEVQGFVDDIDVLEFVEKEIEKVYPEFFEKINFNIYEDIFIENYQFEVSEVSEDSEDSEGYAVYIYFSKKSIDIFSNVYPEYAI